MKKLYKNTVKIFLSILFITFIIGCENDNDPEALFEGSTTERKEVAINDLNNLLQSSEQGWKVTYFTDDTQLGGFSFLIDFKDDKNVDMVSDFTGQYVTAESQYVIGYGAAVKLTFSTKNYIHELSDSANSPNDDLIGQGYRGDFDFLFYGVNEDGSLDFKTNKFFTDVKFEEASEDDWSNFSSLEDMQNNIENDPTKSVFRALVVNEEGYDFNYDAATRFVTSNYGNFGIGFSETGIILSPAIEVDGKEISILDYNETTSDFVYVDENGIELVSLKYLDAPFLPLTGYEDFKSYIELQSFRNLGFGDLGLDTSSYTDFLSESFTEISDFGGFGLQITNILLDDLNTTSASVRFLTNFETVTYTIDVNIVDDKVVFVKTGSLSAAIYDDIIKPYTDFLFDSEGFYVKNEADLANGATIISFTSVKDPSKRFSSWSFDF